MNRRLLPQDPFLAALEPALARIDARGHSALLAVSGGADSMALLEGASALAERLELRLQVASLDHGLRPEAADEVGRVRARAEQLGWPFHTCALGLQPGPGVEARARQARYEALEALRVAQGVDAIWTAHTASDQAETVLMRLGRGASLRGASGILERRGFIRRPLLWATRAEIEAFLARRGIPFARDPMNADPRFLRSRIRRDVLPALEKALDAGVAVRLAQFAQIAADEDDFVDGLAQEAYARIQLRPGVLDAVGVRSLALPLRRRVLAHLLEEQGLSLSRATLEACVDAVGRGGRCPLPKRHVLETSGDRVWCSAPKVAHRQAGAPLGPEWAVDPPSGWSFRLAQGPAQGWGQAIPPEAQPPFFLRRRRRGDRLLAGRKLQDLLVDARVPREVRDQLPLVTDAQDRIVWVVGLWPEARVAEAGLNVEAKRTAGQQAPDWLLRYRLDLGSGTKSDRLENR